MRFRPLLLLPILLAGTAAAALSRPSGSDTVFQSSTIGALMAGVFDGDMTFAELKHHGDFGLGTLSALDGEMLAVDGHFYQVRTDGHAYEIPGTATTPFAVVKQFHADHTLKLHDLHTLIALEHGLNGNLPSQNLTTAIRIDGHFRHVTTRSVPRQSKPYPSLPDAAKNQAVFQFNEVDGVMVGFRTPDYMAGVNVPGYHFHFLTADHKSGGHVLACDLSQGTVKLDTAHSFQLLLPETKAFVTAKLGHKPEDLDRVERSGDREEETK